METSEIENLVIVALANRCISIADATCAIENQHKLNKSLRNLFHIWMLHNCGSCEKGLCPIKKRYGELMQKLEKHANSQT